jgi:hypothetical protein
MTCLSDQLINKFKLPKDILVYIYSMDPQLHTNVTKINTDISRLFKRWNDYKLIIKAYKSLTETPVINNPIPLYVFMISKSTRKITKV